MKTAAQALKEHRATFWKAEDCNAWMAAESQLMAFHARQIGSKATSSIRGLDDYARQIMGIREEDQFYA